MTTTFAAVYGPTAIIDDEGNALIGASIPVYAHGTTNPVTLYDDFNRSNIVANPVVCSDGNLIFFAEPGRYDYVTPDGNTYLAVLYADPNEPGGVGGTFTSFDLPTPATTHTINHNLGKYPAVVQALSLTGQPVEVGVSHTNVNTTVITTVSPFAGSALVG